MRHHPLSLLAGGIILFAVSPVGASPRAALSVVTPRTSPRPGVAQKSAAVANLLASVRQKAAVSAAVTARMEWKRTGVSGLVVFNRGDSVEVAMLRRVYSLLSVTDRDFNGQRKLAMKDVGTAGRLLKSHLSSYPGEKRPVTDAQLRDAERTLAQVGSSPVARRTPKVISAIQSAIKHLNIALAVN